MTFFAPLISLSVCILTAWYLALARRKRGGFQELWLALGFLALSALGQAFFILGPKAHPSLWFILPSSLFSLACSVSCLALVFQVQRNTQPKFENLAQEVLDAISGGLMLVSPDGSILRVNAEAQTFFGVQFDAVKQSYRYDASIQYFREDGSRVDSLDLPTRQCLITQQAQPTTTLAMRRSDGKVLWGVFRCVPYQSPALGRKPGVLVTFLDVTREKRAEEENQENEAKFRVLFQHSSDAIAVSKNGTQIYCNPAYLKIMGYQRMEEAVGRPIFYEFLPEYRAAVQQSMETGQEAQSRAVKAFRSDGSIVDLEIRFAKYQYQGKTYLAKFLRDVTEAQKIQDALRESEERYRAVVEQMGEGVFLFDSASKQILESNFAFQHLLGYTASELKNLSLYDLVEHNQDSIEHNVERVRKLKAHVVGERVYRSKEGKRVEVEVHANLIEYGGRQVICALVRDISERRRDQEKLRKAQEQLSLVAGNTPAILYSLDKNGVVTLSEGKGLAALGFRPGQLVGSSVFEIYRDFPETLAHVRRALSGEGFSFRSEMAGRFYEMFYSPLFDSSGQPNGTTGLAIDITEKVKAENASRESEERYRGLAEIGFDGVAIYCEGQFCFVNQAFAETFGYRPEEIKGGDIFEFFPEEFHEILRQHLAGVADGHYEIKANHKDKSILSLELSVKACHYQGKPASLIALRDLTQKRKTQEVLINQTILYETLIQAQSDLGEAFGLAEGPRLVYVNQALCRLSGYTEEELLGRPFHEIVHPSVRPILIERLRKRLAGESVPDHYDTTVVHKKGHTIEIEVSVKLLDLGRSNNPRLMFIARDVTEKTRAGLALKKREEEYRLLFESNPNPMMVVDPQSFAFLAVNQAACQLYGFGREEFLHLKLQDLLQGEIPGPRFNLAAPLEGGALWKQRRKDGSIIDVELSSGTAFFEGRDARILVATDVTERKKAQAALDHQTRLYESILKVQSDVGDAFLIFKDHRLVYFNDAFCRISGYSREELKDKDLFDLVPAEKKAVSLELYEKRMSGMPVPDHYETLLQKKDGSKIFVEIALQTLRTGHETQVLVILRDISERKKSEDNLHRQVEFNNAILRAQSDLGVGFFVFENFELIYINEAIREITGYSFQELRQLPQWSTIFLPGERDILEERFHRRLKGEEVPDHYETAVLKKDGSRVDVELSLKFVKNVGGFRILGLARDITERKRAQQILKESEERYKGLVEVAFDGVVIHQEGLIRFANRAFEEMFQVHGEELAYKSLSDFLTPEYRPLLQTKMELGDESPCEVLGLPKDGGQLHLELCTKRCRYQGRPAYISAMRDISDRKHAEETVRFHAYHDALTGLPNRLLFYDHLNLELAHAQQQRRVIGVLFLDLDRLKNINDHLGHDIGDRLIKAVAERLSSCLGPGDTIARLGGDEFTILLPLLNSTEDAVRKAQELLSAMQQAFVVDGHEIHASVSIGISLFPQDGGDAETLLKNADAALYRAKEQGRNTNQLYTAALNRRPFQGLSMENGLRQAVARQELILHFQPQVELAGGAICGLEALVRWRHPDLGLLFPESFISLAEENGMIMAIGEWVLRQACRQSKQWTKEGLVVPPIAVNLSARQFQKRDLAAMISRILKEEGVGPSSLELEITESIAMKDAEYTSRVLRVLKKLGIRIAMDDFGTGHSSLSYLKKFPFDTLKIDRSFVRDLHTSHYDKAIVKAVVGVAKNMNLRVVAEGVETVEQLNYLKEEGCQTIQGYLFSRPVPAEAIAEMLRSETRLLT